MEELELVVEEELELVEEVELEPVVEAELGLAVEAGLELDEVVVEEPVREGVAEVELELDWLDSIPVAP